MALERYNAFEARRGRVPVVTEDGPPETQETSRWLAADISSPKGVTLAK